MKYTCDKFLKDFDDLFRMMFSDDSFEKYQAFFDLLIDEHRIKFVPYQETDIFISTIGDMLDEPAEICKLYWDLDCRSMFDFYYRYQILANWIGSCKNIELRHNKKSLQFKELFLTAWVSRRNVIWSQNGL